MNAQELLQRYASGQRDFSRITLIHECLTNSNLMGAHLADLTGAELSKKTKKIAKAYLRQARLNRENQANAEIIQACLTNAKMIRCDLSGADLRDANFREANLKGANLGGADLRGANLRGTNLQNADLRGADLTGVDLSKTKLKGANLKGAYLDESALSAAEATKFFVMY